MISQLTKEQIDQLFAFVRKKYVRYVDVQYELVDHLATGIEVRMDQQPSLTFDQALTQVYGDFPVTGFSSFVAEKEKSVHRYWYRRLWSYIASYMKLPKLLGTLTLFATVLSAYTIFGKTALVAFLIACVVYSMYAAYTSYTLFKDDRTQIEKYLVINVFQSITGMGTFAPLALLNVVDFERAADAALLSFPVMAVALLIVLSLVWSHAVTTAFPALLKEELRTKYPYLQLRF